MIKGVGLKSGMRKIICGALAAVMLCTSVDVRVFGTDESVLDEVAADSLISKESIEQISTDEDIKGENLIEETPINNDLFEECLDSDNDDALIENDGDENENPFAGGSGTEDDPYLISNESQMQQIAYNRYSSEPYYKLTTDLTLDNWTFFDCENAHFDGGGHTIHNLKIMGARGSRYGNYIALFGNIKSIKNLTIENAEISTDNISTNIYAGNVVSVFAGGVSNIENCFLKGDILLKGEREAAGFCNRAQTIRNCENYAHIIVQNGENGKSLVFGGFAIRALESAENLINKEGSTIVADGTAAGILHTTAPLMKNCRNYADVYVTGDASSGSGFMASGIAVNCSGTRIIDCHNYGTIISEKGRASGIVMYVSGNTTSKETVIRNCSNEGEVTSLSMDTGYKAAGIVLEKSGSQYVLFVEDCYNTGTISALEAAGIVHYSEGEIHITRCFNRGEIKSDTPNNYCGHAAGIIWHLNTWVSINRKVSTIEDCYNGGKISHAGSEYFSAGGLIGELINAYSKDSPDGTFLRITNCYNNFEIKGYDIQKNDIAGIVGRVSLFSEEYEKNRFIIENCYSIDKGYLWKNNDLPDSDVKEMFKGIKQCTDAQMRKQSTYKGFDFDSVWAMGEDDYPYPILVGNGGNNSYTISFDPNGGTVSKREMTTNKYGKLTSLPRPQYFDKRFTGWYTALKGGDKVTKDMVFDEDSTVYAHWSDFNEADRVGTFLYTPENGAKNVKFMTFGYNLTGTGNLTLSFKTEEPVTGVDLTEGTLQIYEYDETGSESKSEPVYELLDEKMIKYESSGNGSLVTISLTANSGINKALTYNTRYKIIIEGGLISFADPEKYIFISDEMWTFKTGLIVRYSDEQNTNKDVDLPYWFDADSVDFSKSSFETDWNTAVLAYMMTLSAFETSKATSDLNNKISKADYLGAANAEDFLIKRLHFEDFYYNDGYKNKPSTTSIGVCIARKEITVNNEKYTLLAVPIRGAGYGGEWASNALVDYGNQHKGFSEAADQVLECIDKYVDDHKIIGNVKIIVTGYSRAAGTTNIVTQKLDKRLRIGTSVSLKPENIYGFCFEPPATNTDTDRHDLGKYGNIVSFINPRDFVPMVPNSSWGYGRYGVEYYYPDVDLEFWGNQEYFKEYIDTYKKLSGLNYNIAGLFVNNEPTEMRPWLEYVIGGISVALGRVSFVDNLQPVLTQILKDGLGTDDISRNFENVTGKTAYELGMVEDNPEHNILSIILYILSNPEDVLEKKVMAKINLAAFETFLVKYALDYDLGKTNKIGNYKWTGLRLAESFALDRIEQEHYPLVNFAWLVYCRDRKTFTHGTYQKYYINCPVDVKVYDEENHLVATFIDDVAKVEDNDEGRLIDIIAYVDGNGQKIVEVPEDRQYRFEIEARADGSMDFVQEKRSFSDGVISRSDYLDIDIKTGDIIEGVENNTTGDMVITKDGEEVTPVISTEPKEYEVVLSVSNECGYGLVAGSGTYVEHSYVIAKAIPYAGADFEGWYDGDALVSKDDKYRFRVEKDIELTARFKTIDGIGISSIEPQQYTGYALTPDIMLYDGAQELTPGTDYTVTYKNNKNAFTFEDADKLTDAQKKKAPQAIIKMKGNYSGQEVVYFCINPLSVDDEAAFEASVKKDKKTVIFKYNDKALKEKTDYIVDSVTDDAVTVMGKGNFTGTHEFALAVKEGITNVSMSKVTVEAIPTQFYIGTALTAGTFKGSDGSSPYAIKVSYPKGTELAAGKDYVVKRIDNSVNVGTATVVLKGLKAGGTAGASDKYSFTGEKRIKVKIAPHPMDSTVVTGPDGSENLSAVYSKAGAKPENLTVTVEGRTLKEGRDYTVKYSANTKYSGTGDESDSEAKLTVAGKGNYKGSKSFMFKITRRPFTENSGINVNVADMPYSDKAGKFMSGVKVYDSEGKLLKAGTDYEKEIRYEAADGTELNKTSTPGEGDVITVKVTGKGGYTNDTISATYKILKAGEVNDISKAKISIDPVAYRSGKVILTGDNASHVHASIGKDKKNLTFSTDGVDGDFMVLPGSYENNDKKGTAKVTFIGINTYSGSKTVTVKIGTRSLADWWKGLFN